MTPFPPADQLWWITAVDLPALAGLFWLNQRSRSDAETAAQGLRDDLADYKLEVARSHPSLDYLNEVERRLVAHLLRIEEKLDRRTVELGAGAAR